MVEKMKDHKNIYQIIEENQLEILDEWILNIVNRQGEDARLQTDEKALLKETDEVLQAMLDVFQCGEDTLTGRETDIGAYKELVTVLHEISIQRMKKGFTPSDTADAILCLKDALFGFLQKYYEDDPALFYTAVIRINGFVDRMALVTYEQYMRKRETMIQHQSLSLSEMATPVIEVWDGIVLLPLVGLMDTGRSRDMIEKLLYGIRDHEARVAVLDISGVPVIDTWVARHLMKTVLAASMLGAEVILSGVSPEIAATIIKLDTSLTNLRTCGVLKNAMQTAFEIIGLHIARK